MSTTLRDDPSRDWTPHALGFAMPWAADDSACSLT